LERRSRVVCPFVKVREPNYEEIERLSNAEAPVGITLNLIAKIHNDQSPREEGQRGARKTRRHLENLFANPAVIRLHL